MTDAQAPKNVEDTSSSLVMMSLARLARIAQESELREKHAPRSEAPQVVRIRAAEQVTEASPLVLIHPIGGSILPYRDLGACLAPGREIYGIQSQADDARSSLHHKNIESLAADYIGQLIHAQAARRVVLGGYSLGGAVAFEMARQMCDAGFAVDTVIVIDTPKRIRPASETYHEEVTTSQLLTFGKMLAATAKRQLDLQPPDLDSLPTAGRVQCLVARLREIKVISADSDERLFHAIYELIRHNELLQRQYLAPHYAGNVSLVRTIVEEPLLREEAGELYDDPTFGWQNCCSRSIKVKYVPGSHFQLLYQPFVRSLAASVQSLLNEQSR